MCKYKYKYVSIQWRMDVGGSVFSNMVWNDEIMYKNVTKLY